MRFILIRLIYLLVLFLPGLAQAASIQADQVVFGVYPVAISNLDPLNNSFTIDFYAWWRGNKGSYDLDREVEIVNAEEYKVKFGGTDKVSGGGSDYHSLVHYLAKIHQQWDTRYFPFSRQFLKVKLEAFNDVTMVRFIPDVKNSRLHSDFFIPGWEVVDFKLESSVVKYDTDFGNSGVPHSSYDRLTFVIQIKHHGIRAYFSYFIGFFLAALLASLVFCMGAFAFPARATVFMGGVISFIGNKYVIDQRIPISTNYSLADCIELSTFILIFLAIMTTIISELSITDEKKRKRVSQNIGIVATVLYVLYVGWFTYLAVRS